MKKLLIAVMALGLMAVLIMGAAPTVTTDGNTTFATGAGTGEVEMDSSGNLTAEGDISCNNLTVGGNITSAGSIVTAGSVGNYSDVWDDLSAAAAQTAAYAIGTDTSSFATPIGITITQFPEGRNAVIKISSAVASLSTITGVIVIKGTSTYGVAVTETLASSQTVTGSVPWSSISSITVSITACDQTAGLLVGVKVAVALWTGDKIGLTNSVNDADDIYGIIENDLGVLPNTTTVDTTYNTITFSTAGDGGGKWEAKYRYDTSQY